MRGAAWLRWIEKKEFANTVEFLSHVRKHGISLRISLTELHGKSWNDEIYCITKIRKSEPGSVFCVFPVIQVSGLSREVWDLAKSKFSCSEFDPGGGFMNDVDEPLMLGATWTVNANIQDLCTVLKGAQARGIDIGKLTVGCSPEEFSTPDLPWVKLSQVKKFKGFREFDDYKYLRDVRRANTAGERRISLASLYFADRVPPAGEQPGRFQWVDEYANLPKRVRQGQMDLSL